MFEIGLRFLAITLAIVLSGCARDNITLPQTAPSTHRIAPESTISPREITENVKKYIGKVVMIDGFLHEVCETIGSRDCIGSRKNRRSTIFGGPRLQGESDLQACQTGGPDELLIIQPLPRKFSRPHFRRILIKAKITPHRETLPNKFRGDGHIVLITDHEIALTDIDILSISDIGCEETIIQNQ